MRPRLGVTRNEGRPPVRALARRALAQPIYRTRRPQRLLSLALQGGGSFGAFTWGVLDRLLEDESVAFDALSGASAGAINAVALAHGLAEGGRSTAREALERVWQRISDAGLLAGFGIIAQPAVASAVSAAWELSTRLVSPYQLNPLGLNPLRELLAQEIDFERLRAGSPVRLLVAATRVRDGRPRLFRESEITLEALLASACLPLHHHAVEIDGESYWDGGYSANPPLRQLAIDSRARDILLVQVTPEEHVGVPQLSTNISRRVSQITFNGPLLREVEALADLCALCRKQMFFRSRLCRRLLRLRLHRLSAEEVVDGLDRASAVDLDWRFLTQLKDDGRRAAEQWLARSFITAWQVHDKSA